MVSNCTYDFTTASENAYTPLRYELDYRNYYLVTQGEIKIKLIPPKSKKYLYPFNDYENFEFRSPVNPWDVQHEYKPDFDKIKSLEVTVKPGQVIFIPAFWWYSIKYTKNTSICRFNYRTYMNVFAIFPQLFMKFLQRQNIKREIVKKMNVNTSVPEKIEKRQKKNTNVVDDP